jgi:hypothetical protein
MIDSLRLALLLFDVFDWCILPVCVYEGRYPQSEGRRRLVPSGQGEIQ